MAAIRRGRSINAVAKDTGIPRATLQRKKKNKQNKNHGGQTYLTDEVETMIVNKMIVCAEWGYPLDLLDMRLFTKYYFDRKGIHSRFKDNLPGYEWSKSLLKRNNQLISERMVQNIKRARAKVSPESVNEYFNHLEETLTNIPPENIVNYDETNLSDNPGQKNVFSNVAANILNEL